VVCNSKGSPTRVSTHWITDCVGYQPTVEIKWDAYHSALPSSYIPVWQAPG
jgi:hypothetical protein